MPQLSRCSVFAGAAAALLAVANPAFAAGQRSFVSTSGADNPTCSIGLPCRSFGAAVTATNANGEVVVLDSGGYGPVTITKAISIVSPAGVYAGVSVLSGDGVTVTLANPADRVILRGLTINNQGATGSGIVFNGVGRLVVADTIVNNFGAAGAFGLLFAPTANSSLVVQDSEFRANNTGIDIEPPAGMTANAVLERVRVASSSGVGFFIKNNTVATLREVSAVGNGFAGVGTDSLAGTSLVISVDNSELSNNNFGITPGGDAGTETASVQNCNVTNNRSGGITAGAGATVRVAYSTVTLNPVGLAPSGGGQIISMGNNWVQGNTTNGAPTSTLGGT